MKYKGFIRNSLDDFHEDDDGEWCADVFEVRIYAENREELEKIKDNTECIVEITARKP